MQLIGMLDSPFVRRTAISLRLLGIPFQPNPLSVFRNFDELRRINPVVKVPTLVCDDGVVLMDSSLILDYLEALSGRSLMPSALDQRRQALRLIGLALNACEKTAQIFYEKMRPPEKQYAPWLERVQGQLADAYAALETELRSKPLAGDEARIDQAGITVAVAWTFTQFKFPELIDPARHPVLRDFAAQAERLPAFLAAPLE